MRMWVYVFTTMNEGFAAAAAVVGDDMVLRLYIELLTEVLLVALCINYPKKH